MAVATAEQIVEQAQLVVTTKTERVAKVADADTALAHLGSATVVGHAALYGQPIGIITNNGPIDPAGATKATHFIHGCCQAGIPLLESAVASAHRVARLLGLSEVEVLSRLQDAFDDGAPIDDLGDLGAEVGGDVAEVAAGQGPQPGGVVGQCLFHDR